VSLPGEWIPKLWGRMRSIYHDDHIEIVEAEIVKGGFSSIHSHSFKDNTFCVVSGALEITFYPQSANPTKYRLKAISDPCTVVPCIPHMFFAPEPCRLFEIYRAWPGQSLQPGDRDITRHTQGGIREV
jgi:mannose-6-phosphate isomerase-like protein (cupin superfamily)